MKNYYILIKIKISDKKLIKKIEKLTVQFVKKKIIFLEFLKRNYKKKCIIWIKIQ